MTTKRQLIEALRRIRATRNKRGCGVTRQLASVRVIEALIEYVNDPEVSVLVGTTGVLDKRRAR